MYTEVPKWIYKKLQQNVGKLSAREIVIIHISNLWKVLLTSLTYLHNKYIHAI